MQAADGKSFTTLLSRASSPSELVLIPVERYASFILSLPHRKLKKKKFNDSRFYSVKNKCALRVKTVALMSRGM